MSLFYSIALCNQYLLHNSGFFPPLLGLVLCLLVIFSYLLIWLYKNYKNVQWTDVKNSLEDDEGNIALK